MLEECKKVLYFPIASYFRLFALLRLKRWKPLIVVVTGSNGKTTLLHLLEAQFGTKAIYSHHANSAYGIPFDILSLHRQTLSKTEWFWLFCKAPLRVFSPIPKQKLYIVEADVDRPKEGKFLASLLGPAIVLWVSTGTTHSVNFDFLVEQGIFDTVEEAIAYEYGYFVEYAGKLVIIDGTSPNQCLQRPRTKAEKKEITPDVLQKYTVDNKGTHFILDGQTYTFAALLPRVLYVSLGMCVALCKYLKKPLDNSFSSFELPPGRGTILRGIQETVLIDSSYNANKNSLEATLKMYDQAPFRKKWVVLGDMLELGKEAKRDHEEIANYLDTSAYDRIILVGKLCEKFMFPILQNNKKVVVYTHAKEALSFLQQNIKGGEAILFKGSQSIFLEGILEQLLVDKKDAQKLPRRGAHWDAKRKSKGV